ncbi:glycosyltransferase family 2 protein [Paraburkholderia sp.]|uniref:glycosyltransferase family 2 protein n=1 Tax=Paraburkholderia sp. TaxID=1926495 RepID=UPI003D6E14B5
MEAAGIISVITATFNSGPLLDRAVNSLLQQDSPAWEMIVSPDDGADYTHLEQRDPRIRVVRTTASQTGAGSARNRGLAIARGAYVATLDDDDIFDPSFIGLARKALATHPVVTAPTRYVDEAGAVARTLGEGIHSLTIPAFARLFGSMHAIGRRELHPQWQTTFAQDVLHTCEAIDRAGGTIPVIHGAAYQCMLRSGSTCTVRRDINAEYRNIIAGLTGGMSETGLADTRALFRLRLKISELFETRDDQSLGYHEFVKQLPSALLQE